MMWIWPFVWKKNHDDMIIKFNKIIKHEQAKYTQTTEQKNKQINELYKKIEEKVNENIKLTDRCAMFQVNFEQFIKIYPEIKLQILSPDIEYLNVYVKVPNIQYSIQERLRMERYSISFELALDSQTPPEYIIKNVLAMIKGEILKRYQEQSILGRK